MSLPLIINLQRRRSSIGYESCISLPRTSLFGVSAKNDTSSYFDIDGRFLHACGCLVGIW